MICGSSNDSLVVTWLMFGAWCGELGMTVWFLRNLEISVWISTFLVESYWWDELWIDLDDEEWTSIVWRVQWKSSLIWVNLVFSIIPKLFDKFYANISDLTANSPKKLTFTQKKTTKVTFTWTISRQLWRILSLHPTPTSHAFRFCRLNTVCLRIYNSACLFACNTGDYKVMELWYGCILLAKMISYVFFHSKIWKIFLLCRTPGLTLPKKVRDVSILVTCVSCMDPYLGKL